MTVEFSFLSRDEMLLGASLTKENFFIGKHAETGEGIVEEVAVITLGLIFGYVKFKIKTGHTMKLNPDNFTQFVD